ncbi:MAG TPA: prolyl oligopeptidase family serine peptidase [Vicinamibacterales bacterium]|nr:prolyl oligopeptidase family serine peptidase [Vicinamibacterales bacterium]
MRHLRLLPIISVAVVLIAGASPRAGQATGAVGPTIDQFLGASSPLELVSAKKADRIAWIAYERGKRNVYTAAAPQFAPVRVTAFLKDDGVDMTDLRISDDGSTVIFVRGSAPNRDGWNANPSGDPDGGDEAVWAAKVANPGVSWRVGEANNPQLAPDGSSMLWVRDGQIYRAKLPAPAGASAMDRGEAPFIRAHGTNGNPVWSPDGSKIAFASNRVDHGFIGIYDVATRTVSYMDPTTDRDTSPTWLDRTHILFIRRPGAPFGQQSQPGMGGLGLPAGPAYVPPANGAAGRGATGGGAGRGGGGGGGGRGGGGGAAVGTTAPGQPQANNNRPAVAANVPGLMTSTLKGGYSYALLKGDVTNNTAAEIWHGVPGDRYATLPNFQVVGDHLFFKTAAQAPDEWERYYSMALMPGAKPVLLTTTDGMIELPTDAAISPDGKTFYYCTNAQDIERRHIWAVPAGGGTPKQVTTGKGIETWPVPIASGKGLATISASWNMPNSVGLWDLPGATQKIVFPASRPGFPADAHVEPELIITHPADKAFDIHNQLFVPKGIRPGEKRPAMIFVHGGPVREMLLGYHYMYVYHQFYAMNEWLASQGYVVLSINYRGGVGYGRSFRNAERTNLRGNSEYQDVLAGAEYLKSRPDVDVKRIGIYGLSYGGLLTAQALARNSDIFSLGIDYAGVHLYGSSLDPATLSYQSSAISNIDKWKSPVLIIQGDDDRNVYFAQTVGLVSLLRAHNVEYELLVQPDDVHDSLIYGRWLQLLGRMDQFMQKHWGKPIQ